MTQSKPSQMLNSGTDAIKAAVFGRGTSSGDRRRVVIHKAAELFEARGFHGTSMQDVADSVGITKAALYHYVNSKEDLLYEIHDAFISQMLDDARSFVADNDDPVAQLRFFIRNILETVVEYRPYVRAFFQELGQLTNDDLDAEIRQKRDAYEQLVEDCLSRGQQLGLFSLPTSPRPAALFFFGACNWSYQWLRAEGPMSVDDLTEAWFDLFMRGFAGG